MDIVEKAPWTPGPWKVPPGKQESRGLPVYASAGRWSGFALAYVNLWTVRSDTPWGVPTFALPGNQESVANARLIEAAPELVETLAGLSVAATSLLAGDGEVSDIRSALRDSINRADALLARLRGTP